MGQIFSNQESNRSKSLDGAAVDIPAQLGPQTLLFSGSPLSAPCLGIPDGICFTSKKLQEEKSNCVHMDDLCLCSKELSVWVRFVKSGDFSLRLCGFQTPIAAILQTPRMY